MSLVPKVDELRDFFLRFEINLAFITETWLGELVPDSVVTIPGYTVFRRDRGKDNHGGVCAYVNHNVSNYSQLTDLNCCDDHEVLWLRLRPHRLSRGFSCIIAAVIYHPPGADERSIREHLFQSLTLAESRFPNCGFLITGDFNRLNISGLLNHFCLKQIVKTSTRGNATLDLILTNMHENYLAPKVYPPFGLSDHNTVVALPKAKDKKINKKKVIISRDRRTSRKNEMGRYLSGIDWSLILTPMDGCDEMWNKFHTVVHTGLNLIMPKRQIRVCNADAPWMNCKLKALIIKRQESFIKNGVNSISFKYYRNLVNRERKKCRANYYKSKIQQLKGQNPRKWWGEVKRLSNMKTTDNDLLAHLKVNGFSNLAEHEQANAINLAFLEPLEEYRLPRPLIPLDLEESAEFLEVSEMSVQKALSKLNPCKASGSDEIPNWLLKEYSYLMALPIAHILNASFFEQRLPAVWKIADISPIPKTKPVQNLKKDLRPISLTSSVSKIAEEFVVENYVKPAILKVLDSSQYGAIPKSSTVMAIINMLHTWYQATDGNGSTIRTILFDYRKAFDLIDHSILIAKLCNLDLPNNVINWIIDFLTDRYQRIKLAGNYYSEWGMVPSGVPQGTKLGPWLFLLMINDLDIGDHEIWKYVDDTTTSEIVPKDATSTAQNIANKVMSWSSENRVQLNPDKCKELRISFSNQPREFDPVVVDGKELEVVDTVDLLGVTFTSRLTWNSHIEKVIKKASKRLYFLVQLKRAKLPIEDLVLFYITCIRSVIDYAIPAFYCSLPQYLKSELVRLEKRAFSIIVPGQDYQTVMKIVKVKPLQDHHNNLCEKLFQAVVSDPTHKISKLLPTTHEASYDLRKKRTFNVPLARTNRLKNTFIYAKCNLHHSS